MAYNYAGWLTQYSDLMSVQPSDNDFQNILTTTIDYAEQRIYRDLDLLATVTRDSTAALTANSRYFTFPQFFITCQQVNVITPASPGPATRVPLTLVTKEWLDLVWPDPTVTALPAQFAMQTDQTIVVGPFPDQNYTVEVVGTIRPTPLSTTNTTTYLTTYLPDLFMAASMIFGAAWKMNFGAQSDTPNMAQSWEQQYEKLMMSAATEEARKRWASVGWTSQSPQPVATPPRA